jgi:adenosylcobinamide-GDP ribazoletransferase
MSAQWRLPDTAPRFLPLLGILIGAVGGGVYWLAAQIWPTSIAVVLSMLATAALPAGAGTDAPVSRAGVLGFVFALLLKYNALMALSAANLPFALPANLALGLIMIAGHAASRALVVSVLTSPIHPASRPASHGDIGIALAIGFAPAALIGIPGLIGLVAAIASRIVFIACIRRHRPAVTAAELDITRQLAEVCFYLGALATWAYI